MQSLTSLETMTPMSHPSSAVPVGLANSIAAAWAVTLTWSSANVGVTVADDVIDWIEGARAASRLRTRWFRQTARSARLL